MFCVVYYSSVYLSLSFYSAGVQVTRQCGSRGWTEPNFSGCTLSSNEPQKFIILSLYYHIMFQGEVFEQSISENLDLIKFFVSLACITLVHAVHSYDPLFLI